MLERERLTSSQLAPLSALHSLTRLEVASLLVVDHGHEPRAMHTHASHGRGAGRHASSSSSLLGGLTPLPQVRAIMHNGGTWRGGDGPETDSCTALHRLLCAQLMGLNTKCGSSGQPALQCG